MVREKELQSRRFEFEYIKRMGQFYRAWIGERFGRDYDVRCDELVTRPRGILRRIDTSTLLRDHERRGRDTYHFYLTCFRPLWTDCTCEGYHAENFGTVFWQPPRGSNDTLFLAEKNCTAVSHVLLHELLRTSGRKRFMQEVHDIWTMHLFEQLEFEQFDEHFQKTDGKPMFLAMDTAQLDL